MSRHLVQRRVMEDTKLPTSPADPEKAASDIEVTTDFSSSHDVLPIHVPDNVSRWNKAIESIRGLEARGITRVLSHEREAPSSAGYVQMVIMWYSANITLNNLAVGFLGPLLFDLGFLDSAMIVTFACLVGSLGPAYMAIFGPQSGNRTMVRAVFSKIVKRVTYTDVGRCKVLHGILACQAHNNSQHHSHGRLWHTELYLGRPGPLCGKRGKHVGGGWYCHRRSDLLDHCGLWDDPIPRIRKVMYSSYMHPDFF